MQLSNLLYTSAIHAYSAAVRVASRFSDKARLMIYGHKQIRHLLESKLDSSKRRIWIHASSLGEFEQGRPLIEMIRNKHPNYSIILTFFSPSGYEVRKNYAEADIVCYLPFDTPRNVKRFINLVNPEMVFFVKYEFWRNYLAELYRRKIPTYLISAIFRPDQLFFRNYGKWYASWLRYFKKIFVQNHESVRLLKKVGVDAIVAGDTRFDRVADIRNSAVRISILERFRKPHNDIEAPMMTVMIGSSWPADEEIYADWFNKHPEVRLVIAPHEFDTERLQKLRLRFKGNVVLKSEADSDPTIVDNASVLILDCFGLLSSAYSYCDVAYVGGGFGAGIHNINEAAAHGVPVIFGPNHNKFQEALDMKTLGAGIAITGKEDLERVMNRLLFDVEHRKKLGRWAAQYINENLGATKKIYDYCFHDASDNMILSNNNNND